MPAHYRSLAAVFHLKSVDSRIVPWVGFGMGNLEKKLLDNKFFNIACEARLNRSNGDTSVEFIAGDIRF